MDFFLSTTAGKQSKGTIKLVEPVFLTQSTIVSSLCVSLEASDASEFASSNGSSVKTILLSSAENNTQQP